MKKSATGLNIYNSEKIDPRDSYAPTLWQYKCIFKHLRNRLANQSQILYEAFIGMGNQSVRENPGHMTKMATMPIYGKNPSYFAFVQLLYLLSLR